MKFDFVEIGTSDFDTNLNIKKPNEKILLVEPISDYLGKLPEGRNIVKAHFSISDKNGEEKMFYVKEAIIKKYGFPDWIRGCNSLGKKHVTVVRLLKEWKLPKDLISVENVRVLSFENLIYLYDISQIGFLKIDTEGHDHIILKSVLDCLGRKMVKIDKIQFEFNDAFGNTKKLFKLIGSFAFYFKNITQLKDNIIME